MMINLTVCQSFITVGPPHHSRVARLAPNNIGLQITNRLEQHGNIIGYVMEWKVDKSGQEQELKVVNVEASQAPVVELCTGCPPVLAESVEKRVSCLATSQHYIVIILSPCHTSPHQPRLCAAPGQGLQLGWAGCGE